MKIFFSIKSYKWVDMAWSGLSVAILALLMGPSLTREIEPKEGLAQDVLDPKGYK